MVKIVEADAEIYPLEKKEDICTHIERCGRTCYKSENMIKENILFRSIPRYWDSLLM